MNDESYADVDLYTEGLIKENADLERRLNLVTAERDTLAKALIHLRDKDWFREGMKGKRVICGMDTDKVRAALAYLERGEP